MLDVYASALVNAVKDEPDGLGCISEEKAQIGSFFVPKDERLKNKDQENLLLLALVEDYCATRLLYVSMPRMDHIWSFPHNPCEKIQTSLIRKENRLSSLRWASIEYLYNACCTFIT